MHGSYSRQTVDVMSHHTAVAKQSKWGVLIDSKVRQIYGFIVGEPVPRRLVELAGLLATAALQHRAFLEALHRTSQARLNGNDRRNS